MTIKWEFEGEWEDAQERKGVVTNDRGGRDGDEIWAGLDPDFIPFRDDAAAYWDLQEDDGATAAEDLIGDNDGSINGATPGHDGIFEAQSYDFGSYSDEVNVETTWEPPQDGSTVVAFGYLTDPNNFEDDEGAIIGSNGSPDGDPGRHYFGFREAQLFFGSGDEFQEGISAPIELDTWHMFAMAQDGSTAWGFFDGDEVHSYSFEWGEPPEELVIGQRSNGDDWGPWSGRISDVIAYDRVLTESEIGEIWNELQEHTLTTDTKTFDERVQSATAQFDRDILDEDGSIVINQDTDGDGEANHSESVELIDGEDTYTFDNFVQEDGAEYWVEVTLNPTTFTSTSKFDFIELSDDELLRHRWLDVDDWEAAQDRERVVNENMAVRFEDDLQHGFDPNESPINTAVAYWAFNSTEGNFEDYVGIHDADFISGDRGESGALSTNGVRDGHAEAPNHSDFEGMEEFTITSVFKTPSSFDGTIYHYDTWEEERSVRLRYEHGDNRFELLVAESDSDFVQHELPISLDENEWYIATFVWVGTEDGTTVDESTLYVDGVEVADDSHGSESQVNPDHGSPVRVPQRGGDSDAIHSDVMFWDYALPESDIFHLHDHFESGFLTTATTELSTLIDEVESFADIPTDSSVMATVKQDTDGDGSAENEQTFELKSGKDTYDATQFEAVDDSDVWVDVDFSTDDEEQAGTLHYIGVGFTEPYTVSGTVTLDGDPVEGARVYGINDTRKGLDNITTTDENGEYEVTFPVGNVSHIIVQYEDDDGNTYNAFSKPFIES